LSHFNMKMLILPRQARDKHRENSKKKDAFLQASNMRETCAAWGCVHPKQVRKRHFGAILC
jgi:hypothetical protein